MKRKKRNRIIRIKTVREKVKLRPSQLEPKIEVWVRPSITKETI